jgi:hypothetical protein
MKAFKGILSTALLVLFSSVLFAQDFVSPIGFVDSELNRKKVIAFIKEQVKNDYTKVGLGDPSTLRMMEQDNLKAFKELIKVTNTSLLRDVIKTYCDVGLCNYSTILMMYKEQDKASKETLEW